MVLQVAVRHGIDELSPLPKDGKKYAHAIDPRTIIA